MVERSHCYDLKTQADNQGIDVYELMTAEAALSRVWCSQAFYLTPVWVGECLWIKVFIFVELLLE